MRWFGRKKAERKNPLKALRPRKPARGRTKGRLGRFLEPFRARLGWARMAVRVGAPVAAVVALAWGATALGAFSGFFKAAEVEVRGLHQVERDGMLRRSGLRPAPNLLALDLNEVASRILSEPWVKRVRLERRLPNRLSVEVVERSPAAVVTASREGGPGAVLVDPEGVVLRAAGDEDIRRLPVIAGAKGPAPSPGSVFDERAVASGLAVLQATEGLPLVGRESLAVVDCSYPGRIVMRGRRSHAVVVVRGGDLERKFARLRTLAEELKRRHGSIEYIDLSFERRVIIKGANANKDA